MRLSYIEAMTNATNDFCQTLDRALSEERIEAVRAQGGVFVEAVRATRGPMVVTDPTFPDNPIVFANGAFLAMSGYAMEEVTGRGPHFMDGPRTRADRGWRRTPGSVNLLYKQGTTANRRSGMNAIRCSPASVQRFKAAIAA